MCSKLIPISEASEALYPLGGFPTEGTVGMATGMAARFFLERGFLPGTGLGTNGPGGMVKGGLAGQSGEVASLSDSEYAVQQCNSYITHHPQ